MFKVSHVKLEKASNILDGMQNLEITHAGEFTTNKGTHSEYGDLVLICGCGEQCVLISSN